MAAGDLCISGTSACGVVDPEFQEIMTGTGGVYLKDPRDSSHKPQGWCVPSEFVREDTTQFRAVLEGGAVHMEGNATPGELIGFRKTSQFQSVEGEGVPPGSVGLNLDAMIEGFGPTVVLETK